MCGIAGFYNARVTHDQVEELTDKLRHRGPDAQQFSLHEDVGLIHTRLSIIELSDLGAQPYYFENLVLILNGELYNYREVREELKKKDYSFISNSDTEVLIKSFHCWRERCVDHFIGMFAFAIYDTRKDELFLFRDRLGVKPVYFSSYQNHFYFASELKAMTTFTIPQEINLDAVYAYFRFGYVPRDLSIYKHISKLEPGQYVKVDRKGLTKKKYWNPVFEPLEGKTEDQWADELESLMISAFKYRMVADVPVGIFLSGGIDSSLLAAILQKHVGNMNSFTIGFDEKGFDESQYAARIASHLGIHHTEKILRLDEARTLMEDFYSIYDEPFADTSGIPIACVTQLAKSKGMKVVLSADGADEMFCGYGHYPKAFDLYKKMSLIPMSLRKALAGSSRMLAPKGVRKRIFPFNFEHKLEAWEELLSVSDPVDFFEAFLANQSSAEISNLVKGASPPPPCLSGPGHAVQKMMMRDIDHYLPDDLLVKVDRATMYYGIECREPFLDHRLVEFSMTVPMELKFRNGKGKYLLRKLLGRYVPTSFFERKKQGFNIPIFEWFRNDLDRKFDAYLGMNDLAQVPFLDQDEIRREHRKYLYYRKYDRPYNIEKMWRILSFMLWREKYGS